jgi:hypothetical protein
MKNLNYRSIDFRKKFGDYETLNWLIFEMKMILRNSRPKRIFAAGLFGAINWIFLATSVQYINDIIIILLVVAISTVVAFGYGIFSLSWHCNHFDFIMLNNVNYKSFITAKWIIILLLTILMLITPIVAFIVTSHQHLIHTLSCSLYILSYPSFITLFFSISFAKKINMKEGGFMANYEGRNYKHLFPEIFFLGMPLVILLITKALGTPELGYKILFIFGSFGILSTKYFINVIFIHFLRRKHQMVLAFRKK